MRVGSLFAGIGGFELGFERAGFEVAWQVEIDPWCRRVLAKHWPNVPKYEDVREVGAHNLAPVEVIIGGFPCQDVSGAQGPSMHDRAGLDGERSGLWGEFRRVIGELRPRYVVVENVPALLHRGLDRVLGGLASMGYSAEWGVLSACSCGAPHTRERVFLVAYPCSERQFAWASKPREVRAWNADWGSCDKPDGSGEASAGDWQSAAAICRIPYGLPARVDRLRGLGNAVVPQVAQYVAECVKAHAQATGVWVEAA